MDAHFGHVALSFLILGIVLACAGAEPPLQLMMFTSPLGWNDAKDHCAKVNMKLATFDTEGHRHIEEIQGYNSYTENSINRFWVGYYRSGSKYFQFDTCEEATLSWSISTIFSKCVTADNQWETRTCSWKYPFLCAMTLVGPPYYQSVDDTICTNINNAPNNVYSGATNQSGCAEACTNDVTCSAGRCQLLKYDSSKDPEECRLYCFDDSVPLICTEDSAPSSSKFLRRIRYRFSINNTALTASSSFSWPDVDCSPDTTTESPTTLETVTSTESTEASTESTEASTSTPMTTPATAATTTSDSDPTTMFPTEASTKSTEASTESTEASTSTPMTTPATTATSTSDSDPTTMFPKEASTESTEASTSTPMTTPATAATSTSDGDPTTMFSTSALVRQTNQPGNTGSLKSPLYCACACLMRNSSQDPMAPAAGSLAQASKALRQELSVDARSLSSHRRKKECANDERLSSTVIGTVFIISLFAVFVVIFLNDCVTFFKNLSGHCAFRPRKDE